jgi:hypothetical protein
LFFYILFPFLFSYTTGHLPSSIHSAIKYLVASI